MSEAIITRLTRPKGRLPVAYGDNHPVTQHYIVVAGPLRQLPPAGLQAQLQALKPSAIKYTLAPRFQMQQPKATSHSTCRIRMPRWLQRWIACAVNSMILVLCHANDPKKEALHGHWAPSLPASSRAQLKDMSCDWTHQYWLSIQVKRSY